MEMFLELGCPNQPIFPKKPSDDLKDTQNYYKVFVNTWNVGGIFPADDLNMEDWLDTRTCTHDIYVLGFQEVVPLSPKNIVMPGNSKISTKWNSLIRATLNKSPSGQGNYPQPKAGEKQKVHPVKDGSPTEHDTQEFWCIISKQMVGIFICVWVRGDLQQSIRHPSVSCVGCGIMGCLGNKGSVSVRFCLHETSFCFVCCHLASGGKEGDERRRNSDVMEIFARTTFSHEPSLGLPRRILEHDRVILLGDLNYRISLPDSRTRSLVDKKDWGALVENDQLKLEVSEGHAFEGWHEGNIDFSPTYKYYPNSDEYYGCTQGKKREKRRAPAWCDRILWHGDGLKQNRYERGICRLSDHRSVRAIFTTEVEVLRNPKSLAGFFLSDRFNHMENQIESILNEEFLWKKRSNMEI